MDMAVVVALTPVQATFLMRAYGAEHARKKHLEEFWISQADRDRERRDYLIGKAIEAGVPEDQAEAFVYWAP